MANIFDKISNLTTAEVIGILTSAGTAITLINTKAREFVFRKLNLTQNKAKILNDTAHSNDDTLELLTKRVDILSKEYIVLSEANLVVQKENMALQIKILKLESVIEKLKLTCKNGCFSNG
jgi:hypothetical protein